MERTDLSRAKRGVAALAACLVRTLQESDKTFQSRFLKNLEEVHFKLREQGDDIIQELELFSWTREYLTGWSVSTGHGKSLLES